jgi:hypothetical protein
MRESNMEIKSMDKKDLIKMIEYFASLEENQSRGDRDSRFGKGVIWDFVASDVHMNKDFKVSGFNAKDVEDVMEEVALDWVSFLSL